MKKIMFLIIGLMFIGCSIVPYHKSGYIITDKNQQINLTGGHIIVDMREIHVVDKTADFTLMKKEIKEMHLKY